MLKFWLKKKKVEIRICKKHDVQANDSSVHREMIRNCEKSQADHPSKNFNVQNLMNFDVASLF